MNVHSGEFNWGYGGSGPAETALAILGDYAGSTNGYQQFKWDVIARLKGRGMAVLPVDAIKQWLKDKKSEITSAECSALSAAQNTFTQEV